MLTQKKQVLAHLQSYVGTKRQTLTHYVAQGIYRISRLSARIEELRDEGWMIQSTPKRDNTGTKYIQYSLVFEKPSQEQERKRLRKSNEGFRF